jgi:alpha-1,6-mannosyltransferase
MMDATLQTTTLTPRTKLLGGWAGLPLFWLALVAADLASLYFFLGRLLYPLNPAWVYLLVYALCFGLYVFGAGCLLPAIPRALSRPVLPVILGGAVLFRLAVLFAPPQLSTDILLYIWDGRLINHGINPYHWAPNAQPLRFLRDGVWNAMEYKSYQSIYMPVSQGIFAAANALFGSNPLGYKVIYTLFDFAVIGLLLQLLKRQRRPLTQVIWYAWCPLPITEVAMAGHQDIVGIFFLLLAFTLVMHSERAVGWAALALVAAALTKGFALLLLPLFARVHGRRFVLWAVFGLIYLGMPLWVYLPQFLHGMHQYLENVHVNSGLFNWINLALTPLTRHWHYAVAEKLSDAAILAIVVWSVWRPVASYGDLLRRSFIVLAVTLLVIPTLFPWYLLWTLAFVPLLGRRPLYSFVLLSGLSVLLYTFYISIMPYWWTPIAEYVPFYLLLAWEITQAKRPRLVRAWVRRSASPGPPLLLSGEPAQPGQVSP